MIDPKVLAGERRAYLEATLTACLRILDHIGKDGAGEVEEYVVEARGALRCACGRLVMLGDASCPST